MPILLNKANNHARP